VLEPSARFTAEDVLCVQRRVLKHPMVRSHFPWEKRNSGAAGLGKGNASARSGVPDASAEQNMLRQSGHLFQQSARYEVDTTSHSACPFRLAFRTKDSYSTIVYVEGWQGRNLYAHISCQMPFLEATQDVEPRLCGGGQPDPPGESKSVALVSAVPLTPHYSGRATDRARGYMSVELRNGQYCERLRRRLIVPERNDNSTRAMQK
jgi:hypothetical protein